MSFHPPPILTIFAIMSELTGLSQFCQAIAKVRVIEYKEIDKILSFEHMTDDNNRFTGTITIDGNWLQLPFLPGKLYDTKLKSKKNGNYYEESISGIIAGWDEKGAAELHRTARHRFVIRFKDSNGKIWLLGSPENGLRFQFKYSSGSTVSASFFRDTKIIASVLI